MPSASRRAFLMGRRTLRSPWETFFSRLRGAVEGTLYEFSTDPGSARLVPRGMADVYRARALCAQYKVMLALDGIPSEDRQEGQRVLWVEASQDMARLERLAPDDPRWFVQPGCWVGELERAGLPQFKDQPPHLTVATWLADRSICDWACGHTAQSGLVHALVLLDDGTQANLGAFGVENQKPLDNLRVQGLVSRLFELRHEATAQGLVAEDGLWNGRYRLDALTPADGATVNLAHLLLGHGGELGWVEWLVFDERAAPVPCWNYERRYAQRPRPEATDEGVDAAMQTLFNPSGLFPRRGQAF